MVASLIQQVASAAAYAEDVSPTVAAPFAASAMQTALVALNTENESAATNHTPNSNGWTTCGTLQVSGGTYGTDYLYYPKYFNYTKEDGSVTKYGFTIGGYDADLLLILTEKPLTFKNAPGTNTTTPGASDAARTGIWVAPGNHANITLNGVNINCNPNGGIPINIMTNRADTASGTWALKGSEVLNRTSLAITLADGSENFLYTLSMNTPGLRCGEGSTLLIDDQERNIDSTGNHIVPVGGIINSDLTLASGKTLKAGNLHSELDSANPGKLSVWGGAQAAAIGGAPEETGGSMTFDGGIISASAYRSGSDSYQSGAGIGGGAWGCGSDDVLTFNSGIYEADGNYHSSGIGAGCGAKHDFGYDSYTAPDHIPCAGRQNGKFSYDAVWAYAPECRAGNITINGGYVHSVGYDHSSGFGNSCACAENTGGVIRITGGTLYPQVIRGTMGDFAGYGGYVEITGGSAYTNGSFSGIGNTAWGNDAYAEEGYNPNDPNDPNKVFMVSINLASEIQKRNTEAGITTDANLDDRIKSWDLIIGGKQYDYGAPYRFQGGQLYLWLPKAATTQEIVVDLTYIDKNGNEQYIEPLFRDPNSQGGNILKRYVSFELPEEFTGSLVKYYDGTPLTGLTVDESHKLPTEDGKVLSKQANVTYKYQRYDAVNGNPLGTESTSSALMPADAGVMKLTIDSNEWSSDPAFSPSYWGHRAYGWCEIKPTTSAIDLVHATWEDGQDGSVMEDGRRRLTVNATVKPGDTNPDGQPNASTCAAPRGYIQLYVDGKPVGDPVKMVYAGDKDEKGNVIPEGDPRVNTTASGSTASFAYVFIPAEKDFLVPDATADNKHEVSVQFLPPNLTDSEPANYLASTNPADDPEAPKADVVIKPVDPETEVTSVPDPGAPEGAPEPVFELNPTPTPTNPEDHPTGDPVYPGDKTYAGTIETIYDDPTDENPHPGRVTLKIKSESSGPITVMDDEGNPFDADFMRGPDGEPVKDEDGNYTLVLDPTAPGKGNLHLVQPPNGAFTGTHWDIEVNIKPNPKIEPKTSVTKTAENLTHPDGPTQPGDRIRYTISATNSAMGSAWLNVTLSDALPAGLTLDASTVRLNNPSEMFDDALAAGSPTTLGEFELAAAGADGRPVLTAMVGAIYGGRSAAELSFECTVEVKAAGNDISNVANATGTRPDPDDPEGPNLPVTTDPTPPVTPPGGGKVVPGDPDVQTTKTVENATNPTSKVTHVGDVLHYQITLENAAGPGTCLAAGTIADPMPTGIEPVAGTMKLTLADGTMVAVADSAYNTASRTIAVTTGDLWGGQKVVLSFDATVTEAALGQSNKNIAKAYGRVPSQEPDAPLPSGEEPGKPIEPPAGEPVDTTPPAEPTTLVGADPVDGDLKASKVAENLTRQDGTTKVGDTVRYTISVTNSGTATSWMDAAVRDDIPRGLEPMSGTLKMTLADGKVIDVADEAYDSTTRIISVAAGHVYGGQTVTLAFDALVVDEAVGADIGNTASAYGQPPSKWDPDATHPEPGQPFTPGDGWAVYERTRERIQSPTAYAPGTSSVGGVIPADDSNGLLPGTGLDQSGTITGVRLAKTGDEMLRLALPIAVCAVMVLASGGALGRLRRRARAE